MGGQSNGNSLSVTNKPLRVCYFGTYRENYSRNRIMIGGLRRAGVEVIECHQALWHGVEDRVQVVKRGWSHPSFWARAAKAYARLLHLYRQVGSYNVMVVGYPGVIDVFLGWILTRLRGKPLVWDVFMSVYLIAIERGLETEGRMAVNLLRWLERLALRVPDVLIQDTADYVAWFRTTYGISPDRFRLVPTGADDSIFRPMAQPISDDGLFRVVYYGSFIPNHGVGTIIEAAQMLKGEKAIQFELIGTGPEREKAVKLAQHYALTNVLFVEWLEKEDLVQYVLEAHVCLGVFGSTPQSLMTVQNKIYETLAMAKALISGDSAAVRQAFRHGEEIYLCRREDGAALAEAILTLWKDDGLRNRLAQNGYRRYKESYNLEAIGRCFASHLYEAAG